MEILKMLRTSKIGTGMLLVMSIISPACLRSFADKNKLSPPVIMPVLDHSPWRESLRGEQSSPTAMANSGVVVAYRRYCLWTYLQVEEHVFNLCHDRVPTSW
jgi:hypothetical protein